MSDITFVNLPTPYLEDSLWIYPIGLVSLITYTRTLGIKAEFLDLAAIQDTYGILKKLNSILSPTIGVSVVTPGVRYLPLFSVATKYNKKRLIAGGPHVSANPAEVLDLGFDSVSLGEGELVIEKMLSKDGIFRGPKLNLDDLPFPDRSLVKYYKGPAPIMSSRSCPFRCSFCSKSSMPYQRRSPENVVEEIETITDEQIIFYDDTFTNSLEWVTKLCELIISKGIKKKFRCSTRADRVNLKLLLLLKKAGFEEICVGVESGSQKILNSLNKGSTVLENTMVRALSEKVGIKFKSYFMVGCPGESWETLRETEQWLEQNKPDSVGLYIFHPMPGSDIWDHSEKYDIKFDRSYDFSYYGGRREEMTSPVSTSFLSRQEITKAYWSLLKKYGR